MFDMFKVITKNFFNKPVTRLYPLNTERKAFERSRGRIIFNPQNCILCSLCARKCPADAITVDRKTGKWELNAFRCVICGECVKSCPKKCITMSNQRRHSAAELEIDTFHKEVPKPVPRPAAKPAFAQADHKPAASVASTAPATAPVAPAASNASAAIQAMQSEHNDAAAKVDVNIQHDAKIPDEDVAFKESAVTKQK